MKTKPSVSQIPDAPEIRPELSRILASPAFRGSKRCQDFLQYVVTQVLEGGSEGLKERTLATEVFGRDASGDLGNDSIVRVGAREVRKRLAQYYVADGAHNEIRIELPPGSYAPVFHYSEEFVERASNTVVPAALPEVRPAPSETQAEATPVVMPAFAAAQTRGTVSRRRWMLAAALAVVPICAVWGWLIPANGAFEVFWKPAFGQKTPLALLLAHPIVYHPTSRATRLDEERNGKLRLSAQRPIDVPPNLLDGSDYVPVMEQYVGFGDTVATLRLATLLVQHGSSSRVRLASKVEFNDLLGNGAILVGAFTNRWTMQLTKDFRYRFVYEDLKPCIYDSETGHKWKLSTKTDNGRSTEDYILISRLPRSQINGFLIVCAGLTVYGTEEAGRILSQPDLLNPILQKLPPGWQNRNMELVLHVEVVGDAPALPELVGHYEW